MMKTSFLNPQKLPLVVEADAADNSLEALFDLAATEQGFFRERLLRYGALLFRGFQVRTIGEFQDFARRFSGADFFSYAGGVSPRLALGGGVYTSTEYPPELTLGLHNELSYSEIYPRHVYFFCLTEPRHGGETTLGDSRRILREIRRETVELLKSKKVRYDRHLPAGADSGYSWQAAFETGDRQTIEDVCRVIGASFEWKPDGGLRVSQTRPATAAHPETGEEVWFNQADGFHQSNLDAATRDFFIANEIEFRLNSFFGDGEPIPLETLEDIRAVLRRETVPHRWQTGDVLILDNMLAAHGRMPFSGARKIAVAMT